MVPLLLSSLLKSKTLFSEIISTHCFFNTEAYSDMVLLFGCLATNHETDLHQILSGVS